MNRLQHVQLEDVKPFELAPGATGRPLFGESAMVNLVELEPGSVFPLHSHPHEQLGVVLRGERVLVIDGVEYRLGPMDGYVIPAGVEHSARFGPNGATVLDIFQPVREDYRERWSLTPDYEETSDGE
jgi:quercetin dioxygenase-like cupin family protein